MITIGISTHIERHSVRVGIQDIIIFTTVMLAELDPVVTDLADLTDTIEDSQEQDNHPRPQGNGSIGHGNHQPRPQGNGGIGHGNHQPRPHNGNIGSGNPRMRPHNGNVGSGQRSSTRVSPGMGRPSMGGARPMPRGGSPRGTFGGGGRSHGGGGGHFGGRR